MPPAIAPRFTISEGAALTVILERVAQDGRCELSVGQVAGRAGTCATVVKNAVPEARRLGYRRLRPDGWLMTGTGRTSSRSSRLEMATWIGLRGRKREPGGGAYLRRPRDT